MQEVMRIGAPSDPSMAVTLRGTFQYPLLSGPVSEGGTTAAHSDDDVGATPLLEASHGDDDVTPEAAARVPGVPVLTDLDIAIPAGALVLVFGRVGSGKSSLIKVRQGGWGGGGLGIIG